MKSNFTSVFLLGLSMLMTPAAFAQWSDTKNQFTDSLHMTVSQADLEQTNSIIVRSYPDSGWFVIWQDTRTTAVNKMDIYAQKYDKNGNALWTAGGIPVAMGANDQHFTYPFNANYRNYPVAATDSANGFYIAYIDDSVTNYYWRRIYAQNVLSDGSRLIPGQGFQVAATPSGESYDYSAPQLVADGRGGFYVSYCKNLSGFQELYTYNYKKQNGTIVNNGGGLMNQYARQSQTIGPCGIINHVTPFNIVVRDYFSWPDGQGGVNVVMNLGTQDGEVIGFNRVVRAKKDCKTTVLMRTTDIATCNAVVTEYKKDDVTVLHKFRMYSHTVACSQPGPPPVVFTQTSYYIENLGHGFLTINTGGLDYYYAKGVTIETPGNINADILAFNKRVYENSVLSPFNTMVFSRPIEKYDSLPYELCSNLTHCYVALRFEPEAKVLDKLNILNDTLLGTGGTYYYDFSIVGGGSNVYATSLIPTDISGNRSVFLQNIKLVQVDADSFALQFNTPSNKGVVIGKEVLTGFQSNSIAYDDPMIVVDQLGNATFHIREYYRFTRVSPVRNGYELQWGAMGKPTGTGVYGNNLYRPDLQHLVVDPTNGTGLLAWQDARYPSIYGSGIYMRHLDSLNIGGYLPPNKAVKALNFGGVLANPSIILGTSKKWSIIEAYSSNAGIYSPVAEIMDNYNLGHVEVGVYQHTTAIRTHNGKPYLNRNYTIKVQNNPAGAATINLRLYFTTADFDALKAADPTITSPAMVAIIKQVNNTTIAPATYTPIAGEEIIVPKSWSAVPGGYYIELDVTGFSNFFVFKNENALPVTWVNIYAQWHNNLQAKVSWQIADEVNVEKYVVQHSKDGNTFVDVCAVSAANSTLYNCIVPGQNNSTNYYRVKEIDKDGLTSYSKVVILNGGPADNLFTLFPNPSNKVLNVQTSIDIRQMTVIDAQGKSLRTYRGPNRTTIIDVTRYAKGMYTLLIIDNKGNRHYTKFVVE